MAHLADHEIFNPILDQYDELQEVIRRYNGDRDRLETNLKIVLMKAYQSGQQDILGSLKNENY